MQLLAALDIGTNSFHLVVARVSVNGTFDIVTRHKETVRLGHGGGDMKVLEPAAIDRGIAALRRARRIAESAGAPMRAVATSAVREAENAQAFLDRALTEAGVDVDVISGVEEARLIHLGVLQAVPVYDKRLVLCDIGGGSTEVLVGEREDVLAARSFKLGAVRLTDRFFPGGKVEPAKVRECRAYIRSTLTIFEREVDRLGFEVAVGSSGSIESVARIAHALQPGATALRTYNCFEFTAGELHEVVGALTKARTTADRRNVPGVEPERADIITAGALILEGVFDAFGIERMMISENALREGVLLDTVMRSAGGRLHHLDQVSRRSVQHLAELCDDDPRHSAHVAELALQLFDATIGLHGLEPACRDYLEAAALLANVGLIISHAKHHLHSYYVIRNTEHLTGLTDHEIEIIALVARYHRKSAPKPTHPEYAGLDESDQRIVRVLAGVLRIAIGLDRSHDGRVRGLQIHTGRSKLTIGVVPVDGTDLSLELYAAGERRGLLEAVVGRTIELEAAPPGSG